MPLKLSPLGKMFQQYRHHKKIKIQDYDIKNLTTIELEFFDAFLGIQSAESLIESSTCVNERLRAATLLNAALEHLEDLLKKL